MSSQLPSSIPPEIQEVIEALRCDTSFQHIDWVPSLPSTNDTALQLAADPDCGVPRLIWTAQQSRGRGRGNHVWWTNEGALTFSLLFEPLRFGLPQAAWPKLSLATGIAVAETIEHFLPTAVVGLKWPNDVFLNGKKVAGILTESPDHRHGRLVVGIGINVANSFAHAPPDVQAVATALHDALGGRALPATSGLTPASVLVEFVPRWELRLRQLAQGQLALPSIWRRYCLLQDNIVEHHDPTGRRHGRCLGIDDHGALLLQTPQHLLHITSGSITPGHGPGPDAG